MSLPLRACATVAILLLTLCLPPRPSAASSSAWAERELARYAAEQSVLEQKKQQALQARQKAAAAREYATRINDQQALPIAERALATAERALDRIHSALQRTAARLRAVDRIRSSAGGATLAVASGLRGTVEARTATGWRPLTPETVLMPGEEIRTGADGFAEVLFGDGSRINLHANSSFVLESENGEASAYRLSLGSIKAQIERVGQRRYSVRTPIAVAGVRGTEFLLETTAEGACTLVVLQGEVAFGPAEKEERAPVRQGERAILTADGALRGPEPFDPKTLHPWWE